VIAGKLGWVRGVGIARTAQLDEAPAGIPDGARTTTAN
jgi:hypothetical protein